MTRRHDRGTGGRGQAVVELALVAPVIILLMMAIFQFGYILETQNGLTNAVREAARRAASNPDTTPTFLGGSGTLQGAIQEELCGDLAPPCSAGLLETNVPGFDASRLAVDPPTVSFCTYSIAGSSGTIQNYQINVTVQYNHPEFFPLGEIASLAAGRPSSGPWHWTMTATAQMRLEAVDDTDPGFDPVTSVCPT